MSRKGARERAMVLLYRYSITGELFNQEYDGSEPGMTDDAKLTGEDLSFVNNVTDAFIDKRDEIDSIISLNSHSWKIDRISKIDLAILRLAIFEIRFMQTPPKVVVNEAVELAKKYSADKSYKYINGLLGAYLKKETELAGK